MARKWTVGRAFPWMLGAAALIGIVAVGYGSHLRRANAVAASAASVDPAALEGPPCPVLTRADYEARPGKAKQTFITNDIRYDRRFGHVECNVVADGGGFAPVCQFSGPALLVVTTAKGVFHFAPGVGRAATVITREGLPSCVLPERATR